jgi:hypothetical protein
MTNFGRYLDPDEYSMDVTVGADDSRPRLGILSMSVNNSCTDGD